MYDEIMRPSPHIPLPVDLFKCRLRWCQENENKRAWASHVLSINKKKNKKKRNNKLVQKRRPSK